MLHGSSVATPTATIVAAGQAGRRRRRHTSHETTAKPGINRAISLRVRAPRPASTPSSAPDETVGLTWCPIATYSARDTSRIASVSDITSESLTHRFGYTAAMAAAIRPMRSAVATPKPDARRRPVIPMTNTLTIPTSVIARRWGNTESPPPMLHGVRYSDVNIPCSAPGWPVRASSNQWPSELSPAWIEK